jgi:hypothetical protein
MPECLVAGPLIALMADLTYRWAYTKLTSGLSISKGSLGNGTGPPNIWGLQFAIHIESIVTQKAQQPTHTSWWQPT